MVRNLVAGSFRVARSREQGRPTLSRAGRAPAVARCRPGLGGRDWRRTRPADGSGSRRAELASLSGSSAAGPLTCTAALRSADRSSTRVPTTRRPSVWLERAVHPPPPSAALAPYARRGRIARGCDARSERAARAPGDAAPTGARVECGTRDRLTGSGCRGARERKGRAERENGRRERVQETEGRRARDGGKGGEAADGRAGRLSGRRSAPPQSVRPSTRRAGRRRGERAVGDGVPAVAVRRGGRRETASRTDGRGRTRTSDRSGLHRGSDRTVRSGARTPRCR